MEARERINHTHHQTEERPATEKRGAEAKRELGGICMTCGHAPSCMYLRTANQSVWQCEEFDSASASEPKHPFVGPSPETNAEDRGRGLCGWCEHRISCVLAARDEAVWHCEHYR